MQIIGVRPGSARGRATSPSSCSTTAAGKIAPSFEVPERLRGASPAGRILQDLPPDDPFRKELEEQARQQVPEHGAIVG